MALPALATVEDLAGWMQVDPDTLPDSAAFTLETVSGIVRSEARQQFTRATSTVTLYPTSKRGIPPCHYVDLLQRPVVSVDSVTRSGVTVTGWDLRRDRLFLVDWLPVSVTFTHGYAATPGDVLAVVLTAAQRVIGNPKDLRTLQETVGSVSVTETYATETIGAALSQADKDLLARYRRSAAVVRLV